MCACVLVLGILSMGGDIFASLCVIVCYLVLISDYGDKVDVGGDKEWSTLT